MIAVVAVLLAFPLGYFLTTRLAGNTAYAIAYLWAFSFQTLYLLLDRIDGGDAAFEAGKFPLDYGLVTLGIFLVGFGLVALGHWAKARRAAKALPPQRAKTVGHAEV